LYHHFGAHLISSSPHISPTPALPSNMTQPIDPVRMRISSELNIQRSQYDISKDTMNKTAKHLAFLSRYYLNDPCIIPLSISVPIIDVPVVNPGGEIAMAHKIALVVHEPALPYSSTAATPPVASVTLTTSEKTDGEAKTGVSAKKMAGTRHCPSPSTSTSSRPRFRVLIQMVGTVGHQKCLIGGFCAIAERVTGGLLEGNAEMVNACEEDKKGKGGKKNVGKKPVWDVVPWGGYC
jgi:hypothetical protein